MICPEEYTAGVASELWVLTHMPNLRIHKCNTRMRSPVRVRVNQGGAPANPRPLAQIKPCVPVGAIISSGPDSDKRF
jgi:hypothetical protein